tara:strand:- start:33835 stop:35352 length:1518 start_codon:yes stop_codon:yes gene_type:complete
MAKQAKKQKFELASLDANNIVELDGWKAIQNGVVKENPFIKIVDRETYEIAKTRRTTLVSARTGIQGQDKTIGSFLSQFRKQTMAVAKELIAITQPLETKQQIEVSRYEEILDAKKREKQMAEENRIKEIEKSIEEFGVTFSEFVNRMTFETINLIQKTIDKLVADLMKKDFEEFQPLFDEKAFNNYDRFNEKVRLLKEREEQRIEQIEKDQQSKLNELKLKCIDLIDGANDFIEDHSFHGQLKNILHVMFDFGKFTEQFNEMEIEMYDRAEKKMELLKIESERQKEIQIQENKNRIMNVREGLLDRIFQMTTENHLDHVEHIQTALTQVNPFPEMQPEFDKLVSMVGMNFESKMKLIETELKEQKRQARDARIAIDARTAQRGKQLKKIGFTFNEQKSENFWNHLSIDLELWETMIEGLSDDEWTPYFNDIDKRIQDANEKNKAFQARAKRLVVDKKMMISILDAKKFPKHSGFSDKESIQLFSEIQKSFELFMKTQVERIQKF